MIDINCDMGEGMPDEALIMPYINSANISCGLHAGDKDSIHQTIRLAQQHDVAIGAHPSFDDRLNFGRVEMKLSVPEIYDLVLHQLQSLSREAAFYDEPLKHIKPHGALYNMSARDANIAGAIASATRDFNPLLILYGLSGSFSTRAARALGLVTAEEGFADRRYNSDGTLVPRTQPEALITGIEEAIEQTLLLSQGKVMSIQGELVSLQVDTICIHGDGVNAAEIARAVHDALHQS